MRGRLFGYAAFFAFLLFLVWVSFALAGAKESSDHDCYAPCTVKFQGPMAEDSFGIDYVGHGVGKGDLKVFRVNP